MEINLDRVRVMYLQRCTMTLVNYIRDHFLHVIFQNVKYGKEEYGNKNENSNIDNANNHNNHNKREYNDNDNNTDNNKGNYNADNDNNNADINDNDNDDENNENNESEERENEVVEHIERMEKLSRRMRKPFGVFRLCIGLSRVEIQVRKRSVIFIVATIIIFIVAIFMLVGIFCVCFGYVLGCHEWKYR